MSDSFTDSTPTSDDDPYSSSSEPNYQIDRNSFPKPIPIIGPLLGYNDKLFAQVSRLKIEHASAKLQRPLTSEEASAMAYWGAKQISIISYGTPLGVAAGAWRCWDTRARFRFPFYGPNMATFNPMQFPNGMVFVSGPKAPLIWHVFRALFYTGFGKFVGSILTGSYAMSVAAVGEMGDPRLKVFRDKIMKDAKAAGSVRPGYRTPQSPIPRENQVEEAGDVSDAKQYDDASPSGGMFFDQSSESSAPIAINTGISEKGQTHIQQPGRRTQATHPKGESEDKPFSVFDDASPTGGHVPSETESTAATPTGSAWEMIRRGQKPTPPPQRQNPSWQTQASPKSRENSWAKQRNSAQSGGSSDEDFSSSSSQEDRKYDRGEAQRDFDAKVERERKGGDFVTGTGEQKRW